MIATCSCLLLLLLFLLQLLTTNYEPTASQWRRITRAPASFDGQHG